MLSEILPKGLPFEYINKALKKKEISKLINASFRLCGLRDTVNYEIGRASCRERV